MKLKYFLLGIIITQICLLFAMYYSGRLEIAFRNSLSFEGWKQYVRTYDNRKKYPDCTGTVLAEINGLKINVQRNKNTYVDFSYGNGSRRKESFLASRHLEKYPLNRPNPDYSCDQEIIYDVQELEILKFGKEILQISINPPHIGSSVDVQYLLSEKRLKMFREQGEDNKQISNLNEQKQTFKRIDFPNSITKLERNFLGRIEETYILPSSELEVVCSRKDICEARFWHDDGIYIRYTIWRTNDLEEKIPSIQKEIVDWLKSSIVSSDPKIHTQCFRTHIETPECLKYTEEWRANYNAKRIEAGYN